MEADVLKPSFFSPSSQLIGCASRKKQFRPIRLRSEHFGKTQRGNGGFLKSGEKANMSRQTQLIHSSGQPPFNVFGPLVQFLIAPEQVSGAFAFMNSIVPSGVTIPLHSHRDPEVFFVIDGRLEVLQYGDHAHHWSTARSGEVIYIPGDVRHALRNTSPGPARVLLITTPNIYHFFRELGTLSKPDQPFTPPTTEDMQRLLALSAKHNYWLASPEENAAIGLVF
jgi:quercetin dioxygenase-like cupin family protein